MLTFDAITGNNDRHFYNWGIIENIREKFPPSFSPIYDSARALFWNFGDDKITNVCASPDMREEQIKKYCKNSKSKIGIEGENNLNHFELVEHAMRNYPDHRNCMIQVIKNAEMVQEKELLETTYCLLLTRQRRELIEDCLNYRKNKLSVIAKNYD